MASKVCVAIGVSQPEGLEVLEGAVSAARAMAKWADKAGFEPHLVVDKDENGKRVDVTIDTLRGVFARALPKNDVLEHLIVFFAGHGLSRDFNNQQWLLTHWRTYDEESIKLSAFVRTLQFYQPERVTIIADACRNVPGAEDDTNMGVAVLPRPKDEAREFLEDRFQATEFGAAAYMLPVQPPVCLFSNVMLAALAGGLPGAIEARGEDNYVTSDSLYEAVTQAMSAQCQAWDLKQTPSLKPGFLRKANTYVKLPMDFQADPLVRPPPVARMQTRSVEIMSDGAPPGVIGFGHDFASRSTVRVPTSPPKQPRTPVSRGPRPRPPVDFDAETRPSHFETSTGMTVNGATLAGPPVVSSWLQAEAADPRGHPDWWRFFDQNPGWPPRFAGSLLIPIVDGNWIGAAVYPGRIAAFSVRDGEGLGLIYRSSRQTGDHSNGGAAKNAAEAASQTLINKMLSGDTGSIDLANEAAKVRASKHADPGLGAIAAYLYDAIGDRDSIRRMAFFYAEIGQAIPFDVALLADLKGRRVDGRLRVDLPAVPARSKFTAAEEAKRSEFFAATPARANVSVAGGFPWLRQGWGILEATSLPIEPALLDLASSCARAPFTTLKADAGQALAALIAQGKV